MTRLPYRGRAAARTSWACTGCGSTRQAAERSSSSRTCPATLVARLPTAPRRSRCTSAESIWGMHLRFAGSCAARAAIPAIPGLGRRTSEIRFSSPAMTPDWRRRGRLRRRWGRLRGRRILPVGWWKALLAVRGPLWLLPSHAEVLERKLAAGGELDEALSAECYVIAPVAEVPPLHHPLRCAHAESFERFVESEGGRDQHGRVARDVREKFYGQLTEQDFAACPYHDGNWLAITQESVRIVRELGEILDPVALDAALKTAHLSGRDRFCLWSMFRHEPVMWSGNQFIGGSTGRAQARPAPVPAAHLQCHPHPRRPGRRLQPGATCVTNSTGRRAPGQRRDHRRPRRYPIVAPSADLTEPTGADGCVMLIWLRTQPGRTARTGARWDRGSRSSPCLRAGHPSARSPGRPGRCRMACRAAGAGLRRRPALARLPGGRHGETREPPARNR